MCVGWSVLLVEAATWRPGGCARSCGSGHSADAHAVRLYEKLHLDEARELVQGNLTGGLDRPIRTQQAAHHINRHAEGKESTDKQTTTESEPTTNMHTITHKCTSKEATKRPKAHNGSTCSFWCNSSPDVS